jgi:hypothetical protein
MALAHRPSARPPARWRPLLQPLALLVACSPAADPPSASTETTSTSDGNTQPADATTTAATAPTTATTTSTTTLDSSDSGLPEPLPCNGHAALCDRTLPEVVLPGTHNSHAARDDGFPPVNANHQHGIAQQLDDGVRALLLDVYPDEADPGTLLLCHGPCALASTPHLDGLGAIVEFLRANPREVIAIIYEDHAPVDAIAQDYATAEAEALVFTHAPGDRWPTLGEMIDADTRLLVTLESGGPPPPWLHHVWDQAWDTPYGPTAIEDLSCEHNRGSPDNDLFLVNHWVNDAFGLPSETNAAIVNATEILQARAEDCQALWDHPPNFLVVDFYEQGDLFAVARALNGVAD